MEKKKPGKRLLQRLLPALTLVWIGFILTRSLQPATESKAESAWVLGLLRQVFPAITDHIVRKLAHMTEFAVLGLLLTGDFLLLGGRALPWPPVCGLLTAVLDEGTQRFVPGRSGELRDVLIDGCGVLLGCLAAWAVRRLRSIQKQKKEKSR